MLRSRELSTADLGCICVAKGIGSVVVDKYIRVSRWKKFDMTTV